MGRVKFSNAAEMFTKVSTIVIILGGACTWVLGRNGHHIGASGWIFGLIGYNLAYGIYNTCILGEPKWIGLFISLVMLCFYLTTILSALNPFNIFATDVSGEGHLSSLLMGILTGCYQTASAKRIKRAPLDDEEISMEDDKDAFRYKLSGLI